MRRFLSYLGGMWPRLAAAAAAGGGTVLAGAGLLATGAYLITRAAQHPPILDLTLAIVGVRFFGITRAVLRYVERLASHDTALHLTERLRTRSFAHLERLSPGGIERDRAAGLLARISDDLDELQQTIVRSVIPAAVTLVVVAGAGITAAFLHLPAALIIAVSLVATGVAAGIPTIVSGRRAARRLSAARASLAVAVVDAVAGAREAVAFGRAGDLVREADAADLRLRDLGRRGAWATGLGNAVTSLGSGLAVALVLHAGVRATAAGALEPVVLAALALLALASFEPIVSLPAGLERFEAGTTAAAGLGEIEDRPDPVPEPDDPVPAPRATGIRLRRVRLRHGDGAGWALCDVDLTLGPGRRVALIGESGAGKSSAAAALLRFRDISAGDYLIDGIDARCLRTTDVRRFVGLAGEDAHLLSATVRDNLSIADPSADDAVLIGMLEEVELGQWLASLPDGLETRIGPGGRPVSGGERRLLSLARGLLAGFPILIADEPTAGLDPETARRVVERILAADCGLLLITHTAEGLEAVDEIVVLADGRVAERGTHDELLAAGGLYARFWEARRVGPAGR